MTELLGSQVRPLKLCRKPLLSRCGELKWDLIVCSKLRDSEDLSGDLLKCYDPSCSQAVAMHSAQSTDSVITQWHWVSHHGLGSRNKMRPLALQLSETITSLNPCRNTVATNRSISRRLGSQVQPVPAHTDCNLKWGRGLLRAS